MPIFTPIDLSSDQEFIDFLNSLPAVEQMTRSLMLPAALLGFAPQQSGATYLNLDAAREKRAGDRGDSGWQALAK